MRERKKKKSQLLYIYNLAQQHIQHEQTWERKRTYRTWSSKLLVRSSLVILLEETAAVRLLWAFLICHQQRRERNILKCWLLLREKNKLFCLLFFYCEKNRRFLIHLSKRMDFFFACNPFIIRAFNWKNSWMKTSVLEIRAALKLMHFT